MGRIYPLKNIHGYLYSIEKNIYKALVKRVRFSHEILRILNNQYFFNKSMNGYEVEYVIL